MFYREAVSVSNRVSVSNHLMPTKCEKENDGRRGEFLTVEKKIRLNQTEDIRVTTDERGQCKLNDDFQSDRAVRKAVWFENFT